jgi:hypothetical protein
MENRSWISDKELNCFRNGKKVENKPYSISRKGCFVAQLQIQQTSIFSNSIFDLSIT